MNNMNAHWVVRLIIISVFLPVFGA